ncbi:MAG TPA: type II toxin-antitoxin system VapC family toxin [Candidatus Acidoferrum sp.]|nr:type II toxin-antitoxin system VapC family toxin [Candidatus Acidoferrum sp.]
MIVDSSALLAILLREPGSDVFDEAIVAATAARISAPTFVEVSIVLESRTGAQGVLLWESMLRESRIAIEPFTEEHAFLARQAFSDYGKGRHPAGLNFGDCFSYALAKATGEPLLFKGDDFRKTDVLPALP